MRQIDLHVHTTASDGTFSPAEVVELANKNHLAAIAITDHDCIAGVDEAVLTGTRLGVEVISGAELSCSYDGRKEIHILGLFIDPHDISLTSRLTELKEIRDQRNERIAERFHEIGIPVSMDELKAMYPDAVITRAHFASYLYAKGLAKSVKEVFDRYLNDNGPCYVPREKLNPKDTIRLIHNAGGLAILAHPVRYHMGNDTLAECVRNLTRLGLDGLEALYSTYTASEESQIRRLAKENHLVISGGSDFHGNNKPFIALGKGTGHLSIPYDILDNLKSHLKMGRL